MSTTTTAVSSALKKAIAIQGSSNDRKLSDSAKKKLEDIYEKLLTLLVERQTQGKAALANFLSQIPISDLDSWFDHAAGTVHKISSDQAWNRLGSTFEHHELLMLNICTNIVGVLSGLQSAFKKKYFSAIASCIAVRKRTALLDPMVAEFVCWTIHMALLQIVRVSESWTPAKLFKKFDSCGVLVSFIRCSVQYPPEGQVGFGEAVLGVYDFLMKDKKTVRKFQKGQPCGDAAYAILSGMDGHPMKSEKVVGYLKTLVKTALMLNDPANDIMFSKDENKKTRRMCRYCNKAELNPEFQLSLKTCSRCKQAYYCTQDCQKKDWKEHRLVCRKQSLACTTDNTSQRIVANFMGRNYADILARMAVVFMETGMKKNELVLVIDNEPGKDGSTAPASRHPPEFELVPFETVSRKHSECVEAFKMHRSKMTKNHCMTLLLHAGSLYTAKFQSPMPSGHEAHSDEAVDAFVAYLYKGDFTFLKQMFPSQDQQIAIKESLKPEYNEKIDFIAKRMPDNNLRAAVLLMAAVKRFGATEKSLQVNFGFKNEFVDLMLACYR